jgi:hypothetical protein
MIIQQLTKDDKLNIVIASNIEGDRITINNIGISINEFFD